MLEEGKIYSLSELRAALKESDTKNEFKPKLGKDVEKSNKENNIEAVKDITDRTGKYNGEKMEHIIILPNDRNKTTIDLDFNELKPNKEWYDRVEAQAEGYPSVENKKSSDAKDNGGLEFNANKEFYQHREKLNKDRKQVKKDDMDAGLKGRELKKYNVVNEGFNFDYEDDNLLTKDIVAKDFIRWATTEADKGHNYPINAMELVHDAYENNNQDALEELASAYFESRYDDMAQWDTIMAGVEKAVNAYGYYNNLEHNDKSENQPIDDTVNSSDEIDEPESLDENKKQATNQKMKRLHFKNTEFLNESQMLNKIPDNFKTDGNKFYVKDATGTEFLVECHVDKEYDLPILNVVSKLNKDNANNELEKMKKLFEYKSCDYNKKSNKKNENIESLHEQIEKMRDLQD